MKIPDVEEASGPDVLPRKLQLIDGTSLVIGSMIGTGIFIVPAKIADMLGSPWLIILVWIVAGIFTLAGALTYAELGSSYPRTGGEYVYLREAYGPFAAFLYGWSFFLVIKTGSIAAIATGFATYAVLFFTGTGAVDPMAVKYLAVLCIVTLTAVNICSIRCAAWIQNIFTFLKGAAIVFLIGGCFMSLKGNLAHFASREGAIFSQAAGASGLFPSLVIAFGASMISALWAYDGWNNLSFTAGEMKNPQKNVPLSLFLGTSIVMLLYVLANLAYLYLVPMDELRRSQRVASDAVGIFMGAGGALLIGGAIAASSFGSANGTILSGARSHFALARDGLFFSVLAQIHPRFQTPYGSLLIQGAWASILAYSGTYDQLLNYVMFISCIFYAMVGASVFIFRRKDPDLPRPYRTTGYPLTPLFFVLSTLLLVISTFQARQAESLVGLLFLASGVPAYFFFRKRRGG
jgi:APA family basic amino acid/polyamine antiporter